MSSSDPPPTLNESLDMSSTKPLISLGLHRINSLLRTLSSLNLSTPIVHIAGTNGKGSVSAYLSSILSASNLRVGRFNSPHLVDEWDCLELAGKTVDQRDYERVKRQVQDASRDNGIEATSFEILAATAFTLFVQAQPPLDLAVVEVGMGGATDATNVVPANKTLLSVLTPIELDHQAFLGNTIEEIARVKSGIIKDGVDVVLGEQGHQAVVQVVQQVARDRRAQLWMAGRAELASDRDKNRESAPLVTFPASPSIQAESQNISETGTASTERISARLPLPGDYQLANAATAVLAAQLLQRAARPLSMVTSLDQITDEAISQGIASTKWPGRLDWLQLPGHTRAILVDGAHNPSSAQTLAGYMRSLPEQQRPTTLIIGISAPRPPASLLKPLLDRPASSIRKVVCVSFSLPESMPWIRATPTKDIAQVAREELHFEGEVIECQDGEQALRECVGKEENIVVAGSLYLAADVYRLARAGENDQAKC